MSVAQDICACRMAILTDFTPEFLSSELKAAAAKHLLPLDVRSFNSNSWESQVLDPQSELYAFNPRIVLIGCTGPMQWSAFAASGQDVHFAAGLAARITRIWDSLTHHLPDVEILQANTGPMPDGLHGTEGSRDASAFPWQLARYHERIEQEMESRAQVLLLDWNDRIFQWGTDRAYDPRLWHTAAHPFAMEFVRELVKPVLNRLLWKSGRFMKVLVLDLDETLWGGIVGESGADGIQIGQEGIGNIHRNFQLWAKQLKRKGILLAVASHNEEAIARQAFANSEQILSLEDFAAFKANWNPKSHMIREIAEELNLGLDAFCFLDNSAFERNEVRSSLPEVMVPELPDDPSEWIPFLAGASLFEGGFDSEETVDRTRLVQEESQRKAAAPHFESYGDYLQSLSMHGRLTKLRPGQLHRAHQLVMRTNQFNLRTKRHTLKALEDIVGSEDWLGYVAGLKDRFGDYGWIGLLLLERNTIEPASAFIDTWVMSCRVFERGMEQWTFNALVQQLRQSGVETLFGEFLPTPKNSKFAGLLASLGFLQQESGIWRLDLSKAKVHQTYIDTL